MTKHSASSGQILDSLWHQPHYPAAGSVYRDGVVTKNERAASLGCSLDRTIPFHPDDPVHYGEIGLHGGIYVQDGVVDARPVQHVLGPAVATSGHGPKHVFERQRHACPVVGLEFWHR